MKHEENKLKYKWLTLIFKNIYKINLYSKMFNLYEVNTKNDWIKYPSEMV